MPYIKVNLPLTKEDFRSGNGEGCWVIVSDDIMKLHDENHFGGIYQGKLDNDSVYYPDLKSGTIIPFELRGSMRPVALYDDFLKSYYAISSKEKRELLHQIATK